ncbi:exported protein of unknown function [Candidatus Methylomirabilis oxygeniifera]|uniref:Uncharacterized protein n=1 Tax=Methylomirabilis oxygeniifera TaxID=671143 RepID=D5MGM7_METO1|nr:exported protein of unknown function [Candidatus Methylomirabilis oxyfera]
MGHLRRQVRRKLPILWDRLKAHRRRLLMLAPWAYLQSFPVFEGIAVIRNSSRRLG